MYNKNQLVKQANLTNLSSYLTHFLSQSVTVKTVSGWDFLLPYLSDESASSRNKSVSYRNGFASRRNRFVTRRSGFASYRNESANCRNEFVTHRSGFASHRNGFTQLKFLFH